MATPVKPSVFHLATTSLAPGMGDYLAHVGAPDWGTDATSDHETLIEVAGRSCYRSFGVGLNRNVTRVREGNRNYIGFSILGQGHGSVLEHACDTFALCGVSRILTHELVRHRPGAAYSQESGRYVRVDHVEYYEPEALGEGFLRTVYDDLKPEESFEDWSDSVDGTFYQAMQDAEAAATRLESLLGLDRLSNFGLKKKLQSAIRRVSPFGHASNIIVTANHRAWRHMIAMRTAAGAEEEIRVVFHQVYQMLDELHPNVYQDAVLETSHDGLPSDIPVVSFANDKV